MRFTFAKLFALDPPGTYNETSAVGGTARTRPVLMCHNQHTSKKASAECRCVAFALMSSGVAIEMMWIKELSPNDWKSQLRICSRGSAIST